MELCCLFNRPESELNNAMRDQLENLKTIHESSHLDYIVKKCKNCGAIFLFEFKEWVNFGGGSDEIYLTWVQVEHDAIAKHFDWNNIRCHKPQIHRGDDDKWHIYPE